MTVAKSLLPSVLIVGGLSLGAIGYFTPTFVGGGARPYAYISVMAIGAMAAIFGALLWRDR
jgi:hypothetical protein